MKSFLSLFMVMGILLGFSFSSAAQKKLKEDHIDEYGTRMFDASSSDAFNAVEQVLISNEFEIELKKPEKGMIKTGKKLIGTTGVAQHGASTSTAQFRNNYRQYYAYITDVGNGQVKVVLKPRIYIGDADYTDQKVWVLKGPAGEIKLWETLFMEIEERL